MAVAFMMFILELRRNGGETAATAENRHQPPNFFLPFLAELYISESFEPNFFLLKIFTLKFALKKKFGGRWRFFGGSGNFGAVFRSSLINIIKATAIPKLTAVTHFLAEFLR